MTERIGIVGNRKGAALDRVVALCDSLHAKQPDSLVVSGGAEGVDQLAESSWFRLGGRVRSYRPAPYGEGYGIEVWNYGGSEPAYVLPVEEQRVQFADKTSACFYRNWLLAEDVHRLCSFYRDGASQMHSGTAMTESLARDRGIPTYPSVAARAA